MKARWFLGNGWAVLIVGVLTMALAVAALVAYRIGGPAHALRMAASAGFILTGVVAGGFRSRLGVAMVIGLFFGWWGDYALMQSGHKWFLAGVFFFLFGHLGYSAALLMAGVRLRLAALALPFLFVSSALLAHAVWREIPEALCLRFWCVLYALVLMGMTALAVGRWGRPGGNLAALGAVAFYVSDISVALRAFGSSGPAMAAAGLFLYYGGQVLLASSILYSEPRGSEAASGLPFAGEECV